MYSDDAISAVERRIRWNEALDLNFTIDLSEGNLFGTSGKHFQSFHQLVTVENLYAAVPTVNMEAEDFNNLLIDIRHQGTIQVITEIMDQNDQYLPDTDYSNLMIQNAAIFDTAVGFKVAVSVLEILISSKRINPEERGAKLAAANLKLELEGFRNEQGITVAKGIKYYYENAVRKAAKKLFPKEIIIKSEPLW